MNKRRARRLRRKEAEELNITAFMNLMVVLTPFLLITAVFSRLTILELNLPGEGSQTEAVTEPTFQLEITVRKDGIEVGDRNVGTLNRFASENGEYALDDMSAYLATIKQQYPDKVDATVLLEPDVSYQVLVAVMDRVRVAPRTDTLDQRVAQAELFPEISIGDAPVDGRL